MDTLNFNNTPAYIPGKVFSKADISLWSKSLMKCSRLQEGFLLDTTFKPSVIADADSLPNTNDATTWYPIFVYTQMKNKGVVM